MSTASPVSTETAGSPLQYIKGIGPHRAGLLAGIGIRTPTDLFSFLPRAHQDRRIRSVASIQPGSKSAHDTVVMSAQYKQVGPQLGLYRALVKDSSASMEVVWYKHLTYKFDVFSGLRKNVLPGKRVLIYGTGEMGRLGLQFRVEDYAAIEVGAPIDSAWNRIWPLYPSVDGLSDKWFREVIGRVASEKSLTIRDPLPEPLRAEYKLLGLTEALRLYHFPADWNELGKARERLAFDEFFFLELALRISRKDREHVAKGYASLPTKKILTPFRERLGFDFTKGQIRSINEIFRDMAKSVPMYRLLQGDVGSGKTCVALSACLLAIENNRQAAVLAPTEILAEQHYITFQKLLDKLSVRVARLSRSTSAADRRRLLEKLKKGSIDLIVGTHALLNEEVVFRQLGLVVIDEQHRFGVRQRAKIVQKALHSSSFEEGLLIESNHPDVLVMTATPIPRTLALTLYGDLDISVIDEIPPGRTPIQTNMVDESDAWRALKATVDRGEQAYVVLPLIEDSVPKPGEATPTRKSALKQFELLTKMFPDVPIGLVHGRLKSEEKNRVMEAFRKKEIKVLVATTVIEVGIDVPNATLIIILHPERFGLAQLHQLRGRVGRGALSSRCLLVPESQMDALESLQRLSIFCSISNGFKLAEEDLKWRGPGEILGEAQHGVPFFKVGNLVSDGLLIQQAKNASAQLTGGTIRLSMTEFRELNQALQNKFGDKMKLSHVG